MTQLVGTTLLALALLGSGLFVVTYTRRVRWWRTPIGWYLIGAQGVLLLLAGNGLAFRLFGDYPGRQAANLAVFAFWVSAAWLLNVIAWRENRPRRHPRAERRR